MLKHSAKCKVACVRPLFVTGCGGSGTHFVWSFLRDMRVLGEVTHEKPTKSAAVVVSWASRDSRALGTRHGDYKSWGADVLRPPMVAWATHQASAPCSYRVVAHVVRHPLKVLSSSVAFGQCVECWLHIEDFVLPRFADLTKGTRSTILANRQSKRNAGMGGRDWAEIGPIVHGFAMYWLAWNAMIEPIADYRFQIERPNYARLCELAGVNPPTCKRAAAVSQRHAHKLEAGKHGGSVRVALVFVTLFRQTLQVTWDQLAATNVRSACVHLPYLL